jgi:hypothetical protein
MRGALYDTAAVDRFIVACRGAWWPAEPTTSPPTVVVIQDEVSTMTEEEYRAAPDRLLAELDASSPSKSRSPQPKVA